MMTEYIEREALIKLVGTKHFTVVCDKGDAEAVRKAVQTQGKLFIEAIDECPAADVVEVVRLKQEKSDTVRKMQERLKACTYIECSITGHRYGVVQVDDLDRIADEMLEGEK